MQATGKTILRDALLTVISVGAIAAIGLVLVPTRAEARPDVAIRCDDRGCSRIYCNYSGDRCFRVDDWRYGGRPYRYAGGRWHDPRYDPYHGHGGYGGYHHDYRKPYYGDGHRKHYDGYRKHRRYGDDRCKSCGDDRGHEPYYGF
jgi:hypothetical protein